MKRYSLCPICGDEGLHENHRLVMREFEGFKKLVPFHTSVCKSCESETLTDKQATHNKREMTDFYREADGLLTGNQIRAYREAIHLTQAQASKFFGGGKNAFTKYENGDVTQSVAMDKLIRTAYAVPEALEFLVQGCPRIRTLTFKPKKVQAISTQFMGIERTLIVGTVADKTNSLRTIELMNYQSVQEVEGASWGASTCLNRS